MASTSKHNAGSSKSPACEHLFGKARLRSTPPSSAEQAARRFDETDKSPENIELEFDIVKERSDPSLCRPTFSSGPSYSDFGDIPPPGSQKI